MTFTRWLLVAAMGIAFGCGVDAVEIDDAASMDSDATQFRDIATGEECDADLFTFRAGARGLKKEILVADPDLDPGNGSGNGGDNAQGANSNKPDNGQNGGNDDSGGNPNDMGNSQGIQGGPLGCDELGCCAFPASWFEPRGGGDDTQSGGDNSQGANSQGGSTP